MSVWLSRNDSHMRALDLIHLSVSSVFPLRFEAAHSHLRSSVCLRSTWALSAIFWGLCIYQKPPCESGMSFSGKTRTAILVILKWGWMIEHSNSGLKDKSCCINDAYCIITDRLLQQWYMAEKHHLTFQGNIIWCWLLCCIFHNLFIMYTPEGELLKDTFSIYIQD